VSRTVFVAAVSLTNLPLPIQAHDIYSDVVDGAGKSCCDNRDCRPAHYRVKGGGVQMFVYGQWLVIPRDKIQYQAIRTIQVKRLGAIGVVTVSRATTTSFIHALRDPAASGCMGEIDPPQFRITASMEPVLKCSERIPGKLWNVAAPMQKNWPRGAIQRTNEYSRNFCN
jgi:hypothetical protein